jgi:microcystin-dependent protein
MTKLSFGFDTEVEPGTIMMWDGLLSNIPAGWVLCDGNNGTPDMLGSFARQTSSSGDSVGSSGGTDTRTISSSQMAQHEHTGTTGTIGSHVHDIPIGDDVNDGGLGDKQYIHALGQPTQRRTENAGQHSHSAGNTNNTGGGNDVTNLPQYHELAYIMKT